MKESIIILSCTWKFAATFPVAIYVMKMTAAETLIYTNAGGILGVLIFLNFSSFLIGQWKSYRNSFHRKKRKIFTASNRRFVKIKLKYGLTGIAVLSPSVLSIPVGSFLAAKYYGIKPKVYFFLIAGQIFWSLVFTLFYTQVKNALG